MAEGKRGSEALPDLATLELLLPMQLGPLKDMSPEQEEAVIAAYETYVVRKKFVKATLAARKEQQMKQLQEKAQELGYVVVQKTTGRQTPSESAEKLLSGSESGGKPDGLDGWDSLDVPVKPEPLDVDKYRCCAV
jgi:hypothetical protein